MIILLAASEILLYRNFLIKKLLDVKFAIDISFYCFIIGFKEEDSCLKEEDSSSKEEDSSSKEDDSIAKEGDLGLKEEDSTMQKNMHVFNRLITTLFLFLIWLYILARLYTFTEFKNV